MDVPVNEIRWGEAPDERVKALESPVTTIFGIMHKSWRCMGDDDEEGAKQWIYQKCGISSRAELDAGAQSAVLFDNIRKEYLEWHGESKVPF